MWCGDAPNQKALASKIANKYPVAGIVVESKKTGLKKKSLFKLPSSIWDKIRFRSIYGAWKSLQKFYQTNFREWPTAELIYVDSINSKEAEDFSKKFFPDLIIVSGTSLVKEPLLSTLAKTGIINLHTGLSPYIKGGPNCTNWCIANNDWHLVGNTVMWLNAGIDSGNIITTETVDIRDAENLFEAHKKVMEKAHGLYLKAIDYLIIHEPPYISVKQSDLSKGKTFYTKMWNAERRLQLLKNWKMRKTASLGIVPSTILLP